MDSIVGRCRSEPSPSSQKREPGRPVGDPGFLYPLKKHQTENEDIGGYREKDSRIVAEQGRSREQDK